MDDQLIISLGTALHSIIIARNDSVANALNTKNTRLP
jgi:hypothetical protein